MKYRAMVNDGVNPVTASETVVQAYADHYFVYDTTTGTVTSEVASVCPSCPGGGTSLDQFAYATNSGGRR